MCSVNENPLPELSVPSGKDGPKVSVPCVIDSSSMFVLFCIFFNDLLGGERSFSVET